MPISIVVHDLNPDASKGTFEGWANAENGPPAGCELEVARFLSFIKNNAIRNVVWVTADVHYVAAFRYATDQAKFTDFDPFWGFVAGPINAGTFRPGEMDLTLDRRPSSSAFPPTSNRTVRRSDGLQFYGVGRIDGDTGVPTMALHDIAGKRFYAVDLAPEA